MALSEIDATPFLKWAGGKRWLASKVRALAPSSYNRYIEPFLGSGAIYFAIEPRKSILSDINPALIDCYIAIRDEWPTVQRLLEEHHAYHCPEYYYVMRKTKFRNLAKRAAQFIYLNRTCWNGLYRVNLKGEFNVPIGTKTAVVMGTDDFEWTSDLLNTADVVCCDFEKTIDRACRDDFIFVDPPYTAHHNMNGFLKYNEKLFSWADQIRLLHALERAVRRGAKVLVTNANHASVKDLYKNFPKRSPIPRKSVLAGDPAFRSGIDELLIRSW
jgi:DNA adenine methylase